ncbi:MULTISPECIES: GNAT family N-acetyltransferase [Peptacetobacter]|uniref:GNAT family N-acetyltransferase n=1 Tax=Peptacetobacter TaxID=2743582 RepID=UPI001917014E|nr:GNAT family N-acetyltransferase [Peptacetobacter hiranonis]MEE0248922.1 GNAT family N-acetyltransferase [Peptacetobacter hiranonis]QQQ86220.1 GNAT family N-acetyltransferase [Peptacetobacter hiranonis]
MIVKPKEFDLNGRKLVLRNAVEDEAEMLLKYLKQVYAETPFLIQEPDEITFTIDDEKKYIRENNDSDSDLLLIGTLDGKHVGNCSLMGNHARRLKHRTSLGIVLYLEYTGLGIGRIMIEEVCKIAKESGIEQVELEVAANNRNAISLYEKLGFEKIATLPNNMKYADGTYTDVHFMVKYL